MAKLTPKLPLLPDKTQPGFQLIENLHVLIKQNMKMVILTNPGERVMMPEFGVGILRLLFENFSDVETRTFYEGEIRKQVGEYLPYVDLLEVDFNENAMDSNRIAIRIKYSIPELDYDDELFVPLKGKV
jgi:hypothetical protein